jgi:HEAT repeat protein
MIPADLDSFGAALVSWLLTYLIHSTILLSAAVAIAWRLADQHDWLDRVFKAALIGPILTASLQPGVDAAAFGARWSIADPVSIQAPPAVGSTIAAPPPAAGVERPSASDRERVDARTPVAPAFSELPGRAATRPLVRRWPALMAFAWLAIAAAAAARYGARLRRVYRAFSSSAPPSGVLESARRLRDAAGAPPSIALTVSRLCRVPIALAGRHIVVPERLLQLDLDQQRAALAHEMAHVLRRDPEWRIAIELLERVLFFQPLNRIARARLCDSAEFLCDRWAVRHTQSPLALARCLSEVASWSEADRMIAGVSAMAHSDSAMVKRVTRILNGAADSSWRPRLLWFTLPVALVLVAAPRVTASHVMDEVTIRVPGAGGFPDAMKGRERADERAGQQRPPEWPPAEIAARRAQLRVYRPAAPGEPLDARWRWALGEARRRGLNEFWIVYMFDTPTHDQDMVIADTRDGSIVSSNGWISSSQPPLVTLFEDVVSLEAGNVAVLLHYRGGTVDRAGYRSAGIGFEFGRTPVFWLGHAPEAQSFARVRDLFGEAKGEKLQALLIELASIHSDSDTVIPFLTALVDPSRPAAIRAEAAEGFDHHHDPRSVEVLLRVAHADLDSQVRAEAAETIGEVQTPESIPALTDLVAQSPDPAVRREAAEAFADQPAERAVPAIERVVASSVDEDVLAEAIEALGELNDPGVLRLLAQIVDSHPNVRAQQEAVETLGDVQAAGVVDALARIAWEHKDDGVQREAVETLAERSDDAAAIAALERIAREHPSEEVQSDAIEAVGDAAKESLHPVILELAISGATARTRRAALESIGDAIKNVSDTQSLDAAQRTIVRAIFDDADMGVRMEALDALKGLPQDRALAVLRDVINRHPDARVRREADEHLRERQQ